jgi:hypothetical protein
VKKEKIEEIEEDEKERKKVIRRISRLKQNVICKAGHRFHLPYAAGKLGKTVNCPYCRTGSMFKLTKDRLL